MRALNKLQYALRKTHPEFKILLLLSTILLTAVGSLKIICSNLDYSYNFHELKRPDYSVLSSVDNLIEIKPPYVIMNNNVLNPSAGETLDRLANYFTIDSLPQFIEPSIDSYGKWLYYASPKTDLKIDPVLRRNAEKLLLKQPPIFECVQHALGLKTPVREPTDSLTEYNRIRIKIANINQAIAECLSSGKYCGHLLKNRNTLKRIVETNIEFVRIKEALNYISSISINSSAYIKNYAISKYEGNFSRNTWSNKQSDEIEGWLVKALNLNRSQNEQLNKESTKKEYIVNFLPDWADKSFVSHHLTYVKDKASHLLYPTTFAIPLTLNIQEVQNESGGATYILDSILIRIFKP